MYTKNNPKNIRAPRNNQVDDFWISGSSKKIPPQEELLESPRDMLLAEHSQDVHYHWRGPEFEIYERDKKWYLVVTAILIAIIAWAIYSNSPVMAITFILIGMVGYIFIHKEPRILDFLLTQDGVIAGKEIFDYENLESFWIFYEPPHTKVLSLKTRSLLLPHVHLPIHDEDPVKIREILLDHIPEKKQEEGLVEIMERVLRI
jgi:hypothetical protein